MLLLNGLLFLVLIICLITDLKSQRIYNKVIFPSLILALLLNGILLGWPGILHSFLGFLAGLGILFIPYMLGGMGAGDVKLLALIGAIQGAAFALTAAIYMALLGGVIGLGILLFRKGFIQRFKNFLLSILYMKYGQKPFYEKTGRTVFPYGVAIAGGAFLAFFLNGVELL